MPTTAIDLIGGDDTDIAVESPGRAPLTYGKLRDEIEAAASTLAGLGLGRGDRVGVVLPGGPELAVTFLATAGVASAAPLNPAYRREEFEFALSDLGLRAVVTSPDVGEAIYAAATGLDVPVIHMYPSPGRGAGAIELEGVAGAARSPRPREVTEADDTALLLHTSGTTSRPKLVALSHGNLVSGAGNVARVLELAGEDRCLCVMPLFHIHGIVAAVLATFATGGTLVATDGFNAFKFYDWLEQLRPTWVTAVPAMYQAILGRAAGHEDTLKGHTLRLMRSSSSALPPSLMTKLEGVFDTPVVEALGMTEAAHQVASNSTSERRPGSVGRPAGVDVAVLDGAVAERGAGELVVRGPSVMRGYVANDVANAEAFVDGWFRTGDLGSIDESGFVTLTGRIKEMINRGGEKIGPREVEEVLLDHDAVEQAVVFPAPHRNLGEEVAAAVVLAPGANARPDELRGFVRERLAAFKVPRRLLIVDEIPKGPTGKPQRLTLAREFGITASE